MDLSFEKIIELIEKGKYIDPKKLTDNSFVLVSNEKWTLDQLRFFNAFKKHIKNEYNLEFTIIGGGKSCSKLILDFTGSDENIERLLTLLLTDIRLKEFAKELCLKYAIQLSNSNSLNFDKEQIYQTAPYTIHNIHNIYVESKSNSIMDNQSFSNNGSINNSNVNGSIKKSEIDNDLRINGEIDETLNE
ncbi:MAG: hypothetical protein J0I84_06905, partial [Terrimonas sp.]|nr:hypothetical protein [Terrimonas sp.]